MNRINGNWRDNCKHCPFFEECKSNRSAEECKSFLNKEAIKNLKRVFAKK